MPSTVKPRNGIAETSSNISPLTTKWNNPRVRHEIGMEIRLTIGLMNALTRPRTNAVRRSETHGSPAPRP